MENHFKNLHCTTSILAETKEEFFLKPTEMYRIFIFLHVLLICRLILEVQNLKEKNEELQK